MHLSYLHGFAIFALGPANSYKEQFCGQRRGPLVARQMALTYAYSYGITLSYIYLFELLVRRELICDFRVVNSLVCRKNVIGSVRRCDILLKPNKAETPKRLEVKAASGKRYNFSEIFGPARRQVTLENCVYLTSSLFGIYHSGCLSSLLFVRPKQLSMSTAVGNYIPYALRMSVQIQQLT